MIKFENKENGRFYYLSTARDMLNDLVLTVIRGGANARVVRHFGYSCQDTLRKEIERISRIRIKRGYQIVSDPSLSFSQCTKA